ncbi:MAG: hypothetical protein SGI90_13410 [Candidatus Eisenbacteria bacterium]|nr:hypothetical protein [Candidatus Eisenbacteria bacterium]
MKRQLVRNNRWLFAALLFFVPSMAEAGMMDARVLRVGEDRPLLAQRALDGPETPAPDARLDRGDPPRVNGKRSPVLAGLLSMVLPGSGQFYNGSRSGWLYLGIEAAGWVTYASTRGTGHDIEAQYKRYADAHWTFVRYRDPGFEDCPANGHSDEGVQDSTLVLLYDTRRDDYYEDIGKLDIYSCGWDAAANREHYRDMRNESNDFLRTSRTAVTVVFLNHLVSGILAARGAARYNASLPGGSELGFHLDPSITNPGAAMTLSRHF